MAQVADAATAEAAVNAAEEKNDEHFRRYSMECGFETDVVPKRKVEATAATDAEMRQYVLDYIEFIKISKNIKVMASEYYKQNFHNMEDPELELSEMKISRVVYDWNRKYFSGVFLLNKLNVIKATRKLTKYSTPFISLLISETGVKVC